MTEDDGLTFVATVTKPDGQALSLETDNRAELLTWVQAHMGVAIADGGFTDDLSIIIKSTGPAAHRMAAALAFGLAKMITDNDRIV